MLMDDDCRADKNINKMSHEPFVIVKTSVLSLIRMALNKTKTNATKERVIRICSACTLSFHVLGKLLHQKLENVTSFATS